MENKIKTITAQNPFLNARRKALTEFGEIEHRLEFVAEIGGVDYINDSKSTDLNSTWYSMDYLTETDDTSDKGSIVWIAGACDMEQDYSILEEIAAEKIKSVIVMGDNAAAIEEALQTSVKDIQQVPNARAAVDAAFTAARNGDVVLFSPGCPSFGYFEDYKDRGNQFRKAVGELG